MFAVCNVQSGLAIEIAKQLCHVSVCHLIISSVVLYANYSKCCTVIFTVPYDSYITQGNILHTIVWPGSQQEVCLTL